MRRFKNAVSQKRETVSPHAAFLFLKNFSPCLFPANLVDLFASKNSMTFTDDQLLSALREHFGFDSFRHGQLETLRATLHGDDTLLVMPTGSGKSLCFQLAALLLPDTTLVISPLIALMKDQVDALERRGIAATFINSSLSLHDTADRLNALAAGRYKLVYIAPERFRNERFKEALAKTRVSLLTVDEAHCISQWGHDFRPDYLNLKNIARRLENVRILAVTATATPDVRRDIIAQLGLGTAPRKAPLVHITGFSRPNLHLRVTHCPTHAVKLARLRDLITKHRSGIVYCSTRKNTERVRDLLTDLGLQPILYHGAMDDTSRAKAVENFVSSQTPLVVATNAFGMGVDRPDLRFVAHWDIPGSIEAYYQEVGRAGRDGLPAQCELLYNYADVKTQEFFIEGSNPQPAEILQIWNQLRQDCAEAPVLFTIEDWAERANIKNSMAARAALGIIERAGLIHREILPGQRSYTTSLVPNADEKNLKNFFNGLAEKHARDKQKLATLLKFVDHRGCRHAFLLDYFGEIGRAGSPSAPCGACDFCAPRSHLPRVAPDSAQWVILQKILSCVARMKGGYGAQRIAQVLRGEADTVIQAKGLDKLSTFGILPKMPVNQIRALLDALAAENCVSMTPDQYRMVSITQRGVDVVKNKPADFQIAWPSAENSKPSSPATFFPRRRK